MQLQDFLLLALIALGVIGAIVFLIKQKKKGGCVGCSGCTKSGCEGCPHLQNKKSPQQGDTVDRNETRKESSHGNGF